MKNVNKILLVIALLSFAAFFSQSRNNLLTYFMQNKTFNSQCLSINDVNSIKIYKKYGTQNLTNHPSFIERELDLESKNFHLKYNYYKIKSKDKNFYYLSNRYDQDFQVKISNNSDVEFMTCENKNINYIKNSCLEYTSPITGRISFWKVTKENKESYYLSGIYSTFISNKIIQDGEKNKIFKHYNPETSYPLKVDKFQINYLSKMVTCPESIIPKFKIKDCVKYDQYKLKISSILLDVGVYEAKILNSVNHPSRVPASINKDLDDLVSSIEKEKNKHGWKDFYFIDQELAEKVDCK